MVPLNFFSHSSTQQLLDPCSSTFRGWESTTLQTNKQTKNTSTYLDRYNRKFFLVKTYLLPQSQRFLVLSLGATEKESTFLFNKTVLLIFEDYYLSPSSLFCSYTVLLFQTSRFHFSIVIEFSPKCVLVDVYLS